MIEYLQAFFVFSLPVTVSIVFARSILFWLNFVQIKQYRIDRVWMSVKAKSFWALWKSPYRIMLYSLFFLWVILRAVIIFKEQPGHFFEAVFLLSSIFFLLYALFSVYQFVRGKLQLPKMTLKARVLFLFILGAEIAVSIPYFFYPEQMLLIEIFQPFIVFLVFSLVFIPNTIQQKALLKKAAKKRSTFKDLEVIGITGSFGKTLMKEYIAHLVEKKYTTVKTPNHINVDTGIAKMVLEELNENTEVLVVEMGAYKQGEIASSCSVAQPTIAVMTGIGTQHLELFGSQENIISGKFELVEALKDDLKVFANNQSEKLVKAFSERNRHPNFYGFADETSFDLPKMTTAEKITLDGAIKVAQKLGLSHLEIQQRISAGLPQLEGTMHAQKGLNGSMIIDDTYNASVQAVLTALQDLSQNKKHKKLFVFKQVIELGKQAREEHIKIALKAATSATHVYLLDSPYRDFMEEALRGQGFADEKIYREDRFDAFKQLVDNQTAVLFEGREAKKMLKKFL